MKLIELEKERFENFVGNHPTKSHFLQSSYWGEFCKAKKNLIPYYLGLIDNRNNILGAALLLQKKLPFGYSYFYCPRGFVIDYSDFNLIQEMTKKVCEFAKAKKAIFLTIDPDIIKEKHNYLDEKIELNYNPDDILKKLTSLGFKHKGFTKNFETMQPRYTFRIDMNQSMEEMIEHFSKTTKQRIKKSEKLNSEVVIGTKEDIDTFYHLMALTEDRKDFVSYSKDYYETLYDIFNQENMVKLFLGKIYPKKIINELQKDLEDLNNKRKELGPNPSSKSSKNKLKDLNIQLSKLEKEIEKYENAFKQYGEEITLNAHMIIIYHDKAWVLYAGNHNILTESYSNYHTYLEHIKYCKENGIKVYDQFGTIGDLRKENPRLGLHEFKKKFGGDYIEFLGEFEYVLNKPMYFIFKKLVPLYRKMMFQKNKQHLNKEINKNYK